MQIHNPVSSTELTETSPPLYRRVSSHNPPTVTRLEDVSQGMVLGCSPLLCRCTTFSPETSILRTRVLLSSFPETSIFFFSSFALLLCLKSPHSQFRILGEQHSTTGGRQLATQGQPDSALGESPFCLAHPWWPCTPGNARRSNSLSPGSSTERIHSSVGDKGLGHWVWLLSKAA